MIINEVNPHSSMSEKTTGGHFTTKISKKQSAESGIAIVLIFLLIGFFTKNELYYQLAIPVLVISLIFPRFFYPFAVVWFAFSSLLGSITSRVLISLMFILLVIPVGTFRRLAGKDILRLKEFKKNTDSAFIFRDKHFTSKDMKSPF